MSEEAKREDPKRTSLFSVGGLVVVFLIVVAVNVIFANINLRWDMTDDNLFSLSEGTRTILRELKVPVTIKVFYTKNNPNTPLYIKNFADRLLDFLAEYERYGKGKIRLEVFDTRPDSEEEDWALKYGLQGINVPDGPLYLGVVITAADQEEVIPTLDPSREEHLEYDITRLIARVQSPEKPKICVISALPVFGAPPSPGMPRPPRQNPPWLFIEELKKTHEVVQVPPSAEAIEDGTDLLLLIHPKGLSPQLRYAVDQFVLSGKNAVVLLDPVAVTDASAPRSPGGGGNASNLPQLLDKWGITLESGKVIADFDYATRLRGQNNQVERNPLWLSMDAGAFNDDSLITGMLEKMLLPVAGVLKKKAEAENVEYETLLTTSQNAQLTESFKARFGADQIRRDFKPDFTRHALAVRVRGTFETAFPDGKPAPADANQPDSASAGSAEHLATGKAPAAIIVVADSDFLFDGYYVQRQNFLGFQISQMFNDNLNFLLNACEMLGGGDALIRIRSRGTFERPFHRVRELERKAADRWREREQALVQKQRTLSEKLNRFERQKDESQQLVISPEQEAEIQKFQEERRQINRQLKEVRRNLRADIERLGTKLKIINIFLMPLLVCLVGIGYGLYRRKKQQR